MVDFNVFDSILDAAFVIDADGKVVYCNDAGASFCQSSVRRMVGKAILSDLVSVTESGLLPFTAESPGWQAPTPFIETEYKLLKAEKAGKVQLAIRPVDKDRWIFFVRDVSLEEALHSKYRSELAQKEDYARNLEKLVEARTAELNQVNMTLKAILNSLGQGFFTFDRSGKCGNVYTKACEEVLDGIPFGRKAWEVLSVPTSELEQFHKWSDSVFNEFLPFDDMKGLGPGLFPHSRNRHVTLEYYPIRDGEQKINEVVVVATDKTSEYEAQKALEAERQHASMIVKFTKNKEQFIQFLQSVRESLRVLVELSEGNFLKEKIQESFRILHTIEGEAGTFSLAELRMMSRLSQQILEPYKAGEQPLEPNVKAEYRSSLESMKAAFEAFLNVNKALFSIPAGQVERTIEMPVSRAKDFLKDLRMRSGSESLVLRFQENFLKIPLAQEMQYFDGLVQSIAEKLGKKVRPLIIEGEDIRIYPEPYRKIISNLVHAFRNAVDHGLEDPTEREWSGKDPAGSIRVQIAMDKGQIKICISDDGKGIDPSIVRAKLTSKYPDKDFGSLSDQQIIQEVCMPGFSSRDSVGEFSGRGVGLDALREEVLKVGGSLHIKSEIGKGTMIEMTMPDLPEEAFISRSA